MSCLYGRKTGRIVGRGPRTLLVRVYNGRDPETGKRKYLDFEASIEAFIAVSVPSAIRSRD